MVALTVVTVLISLAGWDEEVFATTTQFSIPHVLEIHSAYAQTADTTPPVITVNDTLVMLPKSATDKTYYEHLGVACTDDMDSNPTLTPSKKIPMWISFYTPEMIRYTCEDTSGNSALPKTVHVLISSMHSNLGAFSSLEAIHYASDGSLYISDNIRVKIFVRDDLTVFSVPVGNVSAISSNATHVLFADSHNNLIKVYSVDDLIYKSLVHVTDFSTGSVSAHPTALAIDDSSIWVAQSDGNLLKYDTAGTRLNTFSSSTTPSVNLDGNGISVSQHHVYLTNGDVISVYQKSDLSHVRDIGIVGNVPGNTKDVMDVHVEGSLVYILNSHHNSTHGNGVVVYDTSGNHIAHFGHVGDIAKNQLDNPQSMSVYGHMILVTEGDSNTVRAISKSQMFEKSGGYDSYKQMQGSEDNNLPIIKQSSKTFIDLNDSYKHKAKCFDAVDGYILPTVAGALNTSQTGFYELTHTCNDAAGNSATMMEQVFVIDPNNRDTTRPVITLKGDSSVRIPYGTPYVDAGAMCVDDVDGTLRVSVTGNDVDVNTVGYYYVDYDCFDYSGNVASEYRDVEVYDEIAPVVTITGPSTIRVSVDDDYVDQGATCHDEYDGTFKPYTVNQVYTTRHPGDYSVLYLCTDSSDNTANATRTVVVGNVTSDSTAPTITIQANGTTGTPTTLFTFSAVAADASGIASVVWYDGLTQIGTGTSITKTFTAGTHVITAVATDGSSNSNQKTSNTVTLTITAPPPPPAADTTAPTITISANPTSGTTATSITLTATASDASGIASVVWYDGSTQIGTGNTITKTFGVGTHSITAIATDGSSNSNQKTSNTVTLTITAPPSVDTTAPTITISANPTSGTTATSITLTATASDASGIASVVWYDGSTRIGTGTTLTKTFGVGTHNIKAVATDGSSNSNQKTSNIVALTITAPPAADTTAPTITISANPTSGTTATSITLTATASDASGIASVVWYDGSTQIGTGNSITKTFTAGTHVITAVATDGSSNANTATSSAITLSILATSKQSLQSQDSIPPTIFADMMQNMPINTQFEDSTTCSDNVDGALQPNATGTLDTTTIGQYMLTYSCVDKSGNEAKEKQSLVVVVNPDSTDHDSPTVTMTAVDGSVDLSLPLHARFVEPGVRCIDNVDPPRGPSIVYSNVDTSKPGFYVIEYVCVDSNANVASDFRYVTVYDALPPVISLLGPDPYYVRQSNIAYWDPGATCVDDYDGDLSGTNSLYNDQYSVDTLVPGNYRSIFTCTDYAGNISNATRTVVVQASDLNGDTVVPEIRSLSATPMEGDTSTPITFTTTVQDDSGIKMIKWYDGTRLLHTDRVNNASADAITRQYTATFGVGDHIIVALIYDKSANENVISKAILTPITIERSTTTDSTKPTIRISSTGTSGTTLTSFTLSATASDASGIASVVWYDGSTRIGTGSSITKIFGVGTHSITAVATDGSSNNNQKRSNTITLTVTAPPSVDTTAPTITISANPASGTSATPITLTATASDASGIASVVWYDGSTRIGTGTTLTKTFGVGTHNIKAVATDGSSNSNQKTSNIVALTITAPPAADTTAPTITISANPTSGTTATSITLTATASDASGIASVVWYDRSTQIGTGNSITKTFTAGTHVITAVATDGSSNANTATSSAITLSILAVAQQQVQDTTAPTITISANPTSGTTATSITLTANANDASGIKSIKWYDGSKKIGNGTSITKTFDVGTRSIYAVATDNRNNEQRSNTVTLTISAPPSPPVDTTAPTITISANPTSGTTATSITLTATASDASGIASVVWYDGSTRIGTGTTLTKTFGVGTHNIKAVATDGSSNSNQKTSNIVALTITAPPAADTTAPTITISANPTSGTTATSITLTATASDASGIASVVWYDRSTQIGTGNSITKTFTAGTHVITAVATDGSSNANTATSSAITLSILAVAQQQVQDTTAPTITISANPTSGTTATSITLTANANDASGIKSIKWYDGSKKIGNGTSITKTFDVGTRSIYAVATDNRNNEQRSNTVTLTISAPPSPPVDTTAPTITISANPTSGTTTTSITLTATASDASGIASVVWYDGSTRIGTGTTLTTTFGVGTHSITAVATDGSSNNNQKRSNTITLTITAPPAAVADTIAPTITISANPTSGTTATSITLTATANDASGIASVVWYDGSTRIGTGSTLTKTFGVGTHNIKAVATDGSSNANTATSSVLTLTITAPPPPADTTAPTITISANPTSGTTATSITLTATANDASGIASVVWYDGSTRIGTGTTLTKTFGVGTHNIKAVATDGSSNANTATSSVLTLTITAPPPPADITAPTITISANPTSGNHCHFHHTHCHCK